MATSIPPYTWQNGFRQPVGPSPAKENLGGLANGPVHYVPPPSSELPTSTVNNSLGSNLLRTWPTLYNGTESPHGLPSWWNPSDEVDVLIVGGGPTGLETALSLTRQGVSFRILDKGKTPLIAGRADSVLPRYLETLASWGIASEVHEEGPIIERTAIYKDGKMLFHGRTHQSDSRYRGLHVITQGQLERIFIRDLVRHRVLVERDTQLLDYDISKDPSESHPVKATIRSGDNGKEEVIRAKFLVGCDGAASPIRHKLGIPFDGVSTDIYWGIMDCKFESDYPHAWIFGGVLNTEHGACVIIPREDGYNRLYTQLDISSTGAIVQSRQANDPSFQEAGGNVDVHSVTPEEVLAQVNRIFSPYKVTFGAPLSWFAIWKVSERVARNFSSEDLRVHLAGDAAHVHSVFGAFGLNASILDAANLGWKIGLCARGKADMHKLLLSYDRERRLHAADIIDVSGTYLRYSCNRWDQPVPKLHRNGADFGDEAIERSIRGKVSGIQMPPGVKLPEHLFLADFYMRYGAFLLGMDVAYGASMLNVKQEAQDGQRPVTVENGVRCPSPRVCFSEGESGYLYDKMNGSALFHILVFASDLLGPVREGLKLFSASLSEGFYSRYGGREVFNIVLITKCLPFEIAERMADPELRILGGAATMVYDDRPPDEDAHFTWGVDHAKGAIVVVRPDLWVGMSAFPGETVKLDHYFGNFLLPYNEVKKADRIAKDTTANGQKADTHLIVPTNGYQTDVAKDGLHVNESTNGYEFNQPASGDAKIDFHHADRPMQDYTINGSTNWERRKEVAMKGSQSDSNGYREPTDEMKSKTTAFDGAQDGLTIEEAKSKIPVDEPAVSIGGEKGEYFVTEFASINGTH